MWKATSMIAAALVMVWAGAVEPGESKDARTVIDKAIKALGGEANVVKHKSASWSEKGTYYGMGEGIPYTGTYAIEWPDKFRMEIKNFFTIVLNGDKGWVQSKQGTKDMDKEEITAQQQEHKASWITTLWPLEDKEFKLKSLPDAKVDSKTVVGVEVSRKGYPDVKLYFDKEGGLLVKSEFRTHVPEEKKEVMMETHYRNYKVVDGLKVPHKLVMNRDGKRFVEAELENMKVGGKLDDKLFAKPQ